MFKKTHKIKDNWFIHISETAMNLFIVWEQLHDEQFKVMQHGDKLTALFDYNQRIKNKG